MSTCQIVMLTFLTSRHNDWQVDINNWHVSMKTWQVDTIIWQVGKLTDKWCQKYTTIPSRPRNCRFLLSVSDDIGGSLKRDSRYVRSSRSVHSVHKDLKDLNTTTLICKHAMGLSKNASLLRSWRSLCS